MNCQANLNLTVFIAVNHASLSIITLQHAPLSKALVLFFFTAQLMIACQSSPNAGILWASRICYVNRSFGSYLYKSAEVRETASLIDSKLPLQSAMDIMITLSCNIYDGVNNLLSTAKNCGSYGDFGSSVVIWGSLFQSVDERYFTDVENICAW